MAETVTRKSKRRPTKDICIEERLCSFNIVIVITRIGNLKSFEYREESEFEISFKYLSNVINCKNINNISEDTNRFKVLGNNDEESVNLEYILKISLINDDLFNLAGYPAEISLIQHHKDEQKSILGYTCLDFYPLFSNQIEKRNVMLHFERDENPENLLQLFRKPYIELTVSTDQPIIQEPNTVVNSMIITVDSICNISSTCSTVEVGFMVPFEANFRKKIIFLNPQHCGRSKKWFNLSHIYGKGGDSSFIDTCLKNNLKKKENEMLEKITIEDTIKFNSIARAILSHESVSFLYDHIRRNKKLAIEVTVDEKHLIGFIDLEELVHVNINKIRTVVPLTQFNEFTFIMNCGAYSSAFEEKIESKKSLNSKKNISLKKIQNFANDTQAVTSEILYNSEGNPMFVILEIELQKPLNEEVFLEIDMFRHPDNSISSFKQVVKCQLKENIRNKIKFQTKNLLKIYEQEGDLENIFNTTVNNGYVGKIVDSLMVDIYELAKDQFNSSTSNNNNNNNGHLLSTLMCEMKSTVLNEPKIESDHHTNKLLAKIYYELNIKDRSNDIFLKRLLNENFSEASWISYGIHNLRSQKFNEANVCFEESLQINNRSLLGNILKSYISFKQQKYNECERLLNFVLHINPELLEVEFMKHLLNIKQSGEENLIQFKNLKSHQEFDEIYNEHEILWFSTPDNKLLNFQNYNIKFAVFCIKLGCFEYAEFVLAEYLLQFGSNLNYLYLMAVIDAMRDEHANALIHLNKISKMDIGNHAVNYEKITIFIAVLLMKLGKFSSAEKLFINGIKLISPTTVEYVLILLQFGIYYKDNNKFDCAEELLVKAVKIFPFDISFMELGKCYQSLNNLPFAEKCFHTAINMNGKQVQAWKELSLIYNQRPQMTDFCIQNNQ